MKTIRQLADELGVSKTAIRNCMDDAFRAKYTGKNSKGSITISADGCKLISEKYRKSTENTGNPVAETTEKPVSGDVVELLQTTIEALREQLAAKDQQLAAKDQQIMALTEAVKSQAQSINADRHTELAEQLKLLPNAAAPEATAPEASEQKAKKGFWQRVLGG